MHQPMSATISLSDDNNDEMEMEWKENENWMNTKLKWKWNEKETKQKWTDSTIDGGNYANWWWQKVRQPMTPAIVSMDDGGNQINNTHLQALNCTRSYNNQPPIEKQCITYNWASDK